MASTGINNGTLTGIYIGGTLISHGTTNDFSLEHSTRDASTKDSSGYRDILEGQRSYSFSFDGYVAENATYGFNDLYDAWTGRTQLTVRWSSAVSGDEYYEGTCYLTSLSTSAAVEDSQTFSASFEGTGTITNGTVV